jgi:hypothetical protein
MSEVGSASSMKASALSRTYMHTRACTPKSAPFRSMGKSCSHRRPRLVLNRCGWTRSDPTIYSVTTSTMIINFELPCGSGAPNQFDGDVLHTMSQLRATPRANRTLIPVDNPILYATSSTAAQRACGPSLLLRLAARDATPGARSDVATAARSV